MTLAFKHLMLFSLMTYNAGPHKDFVFTETKQKHHPKNKPAQGESIAVVIKLNKNKYSMAIVI